MASIVQFVDSITASPTVRLDLNSAASGWMIDHEAGIDISPPTLNYAVASTMLADGEHIAGSSFQNRVLKLPIKLVYTATTDAAATAIQNLGRELNRPMNIVKLQLQGATSPVFFRTFRSSYTLSMLRLLLTEHTKVTLELPTEYAGLGLLETPVSAVTVSTDPAAATNPCFVDVSGVKGDVEAPAIIRWPSSAIADDQETVFATRRRGTPSAAPFLFQAEAMTQGTDTTTQPNDVNFSGSGNNYSRCTFATATMQMRLQITDLGTPSVDLRGTYRVFLRYRKNTSGDAINLQLRWGDTVGFLSVNNDVFVTPNTNQITTADLGLISIPIGVDPVYDSTGAELVVSDSFLLKVQAERTSGTGTIDFDFLLLVPAGPEPESRFGIVHWNDASSSPTDHWILDADGTIPHARDASGQIISAGSPAITSGFTFLSPNQTNRIYMLRSTRAGDTWTLTTVSPVSVSYHPRYLSVRPAST